MRHHATRFMRSTVALMASLGLLLTSGTAVFAAEDIPSDVANVKAVAGDAKVTLTWDKAESTAALKGYRVYWGNQKVTSDPTTRYTDKMDVGNVLTYDVSGLTNDKKYYFAIIALDVNDKHSANYSDAVSATPNDGTSASSVAPKVASAIAMNNREVKVTFTKEVKLPATNPEKAFSIIENILQQKLEVLGATVSVDDKKSVILTTEAQTKTAEYIITAHSELMDMDGNPIKSGYSDTASFTGSSIEKATTTPSAEPSATPTGTATPGGTDTTPPSIEKVMSEGNTKIKIMFSEPVVLSTIKPENHFTITEKANPLSTIEIKKVTQEEDKKTITIETALQKADAEYEITVTQIVDGAGNSIPELLENNKATYTAKVAEIKDIIPPEDVTKFLSKIVGNSIMLTWTASIDTAKDLAEQIIYQSLDGKTFKQIAKLQPRITKYTVSSLKRGIEYTFKITQKDKAGNESKGVALAVTLPETGAGLGMLALSALGGLAFAHRRRRK